LSVPADFRTFLAADILADRDLVTVDGHLGIVSVGQPEFDLELRARAGAGA